MEPPETVVGHMKCVTKIESPIIINISNRLALLWLCKPSPWQALVPLCQFGYHGSNKDKIWPCNKFFKWGQGWWEKHDKIRMCDTLVLHHQKINMGIIIQSTSRSSKWSWRDGYASGILKNSASKENTCATKILGTQNFCQQTWPYHSNQ